MGLPIRLHALRWVVVGGVLAGAYDIAFACIYWALARAVPAERILQSIASGLLGKASYQGGWSTALMGLALHFFMTLLMSFAYYAVARHVAVLWRRPMALGASYGALLYAIMNFAVVPLSNAAVRGAGNDLWTWLSVVAHVVLVGIPIALSTRYARLAR